MNCGYNDSANYRSGVYNFPTNPPVLNSLFEVLLLFFVLLFLTQ